MLLLPLLFSLLLLHPSHCAHSVMDGRWSIFIYLLLSICLFNCLVCWCCLYGCVLSLRVVCVACVRAFVVLLRALAVLIRWWMVVDRFLFIFCCLFVYLFVLYVGVCWCALFCCVLCALYVLCMAVSCGRCVSCACRVPRVCVVVLLRVWGTSVLPPERIFGYCFVTGRPHISYRASCINSILQCSWCAVL